MTCQHKDCTLRSGFNVKDVKTPKFCSQYKKSGMVMLLIRLVILKIVKFFLISIFLDLSVVLDAEIT